jgi:hypothetical protein
MQISEITRRNIVDDLRLRQTRWCGRLSETEFLSRIVDLGSLPSTDRRLKNMEEDILQHRVADDDWPEDWIYDDKRLKLLSCDDVQFLRFLCAVIHPLTRTDPSEITELLGLFNSHLEADGYEIYESERRSHRPIFASRLITAPITLDRQVSVDSGFIREQLEKCDSKLQSQDYDGAITNARALVESVLAEIHQRCTGKSLPSSGSLLADYKRVKDLLNLSEHQHVQEGLKALVRAFNGIIDSIDSLSNKLGDRHRRILKPEKHHAKLVLFTFVKATESRKTSRNAWTTSRWPG